MKNLQSTILRADAARASASALALMLLLGLSASAAAQSRQANSEPQTYATGEKIVVYVWEAATPTAEGSDEGLDPKLSRAFAQSGLGAMAMLSEWQRHIAYSLRNGYPLSETWIAIDRERADFALRRATLSTSTEADRIALRALVNQFENLRHWSDGLIEANRDLSLAQYYMSPAALENDPTFQKTTACGGFLISMLASGRLAEDASCQ